MTAAYDTIVAYHEATKHHFHRYARSAGFMDWANQPNPFRYYDGAEKIPLALDPGDPDLPYDDLHTPAAGSPRSLDESSISSFLVNAMGLSAWKGAGAGRWSLRINPSSGNLHPTETHLVLPPELFSGGGVFHYACFDHCLERRARLPQGLRPRMESHFGGPGFLVALSSIFWRESWKYGERAYRYCNLDAGHAVAALSYAARLHNWALTCLTGAGDGQIRSLLGFDGILWHPLEDEVPELVCWVSMDPENGTTPQTLPDRLGQPFQAQPFQGSPNRLSPQPVDWSAIAKASHGAKKNRTNKG